MPPTRKKPLRADAKILRAGIESELKRSIAVKLELLEHHHRDIAKAVKLWAQTLANGGKIMLCGNGGSAADAQHIATEMVVRLKKNRQALPAIALTTDTSTLTAAGNDYGFEKIFARQVEAHGERGDLLVAISTSGKSANILAAAKQAKKHGVKVLALTGTAPNPLVRSADLALAVPAHDTQRIQEAHITLLHILCGQSEKLLLKK